MPRRTKGRLTRIREDLNLLLAIWKNEEFKPVVIVSTIVRSIFRRIWTMPGTTTIASPMDIGDNIVVLVVLRVNDSTRHDVDVDVEERMHNSNVKTFFLYGIS